MKPHSGQIFSIISGCLLVGGIIAVVAAIWIGTHPPLRQPTPFVQALFLGGVLATLFGMIVSAAFLGERGKPFGKKIQFILRFCGASLCLAGIATASWAAGIDSVNRSNQVLLGQVYLLSLISLCVGLFCIGKAMRGGSVN